MKFSMALPYIVNTILLGLLIYLGVCYFNDSQWTFLFGTGIHKFGRLHIFLVHFSVGLLVLLPLAETYLFFDLDLAFQLRQVRFWLHQLCHFLTLMTLTSGFLMQLIERYQNPLILNHLLGGIAAYGALTVFSIFCFTGSALGKFRMVFSMALLAVVVNTASIGGTIYKGLGFFNI